MTREPAELPAGREDIPVTLTEDQTGHSIL